MVKLGFFILSSKVEKQMVLNNPEFLNQVLIGIDYLWNKLMCFKMVSGLRKKELLVFTLFFIMFSSFSQNFIWNAGFHGFFDNREYFNTYTNDQTIFGSRIFGDAGFSVDARNSFAGGFSYLYELGSKGNLIDPDITLYYSYKGDITFSLGAFPRHNLINQPLFLLTDTFNYYRPNVEGMFLEYRKPFFYHNIWVDWTGRQALDKKEAILIGGSGKIQKNIFFYEHHFSFYHFALPVNPSPNDHIRDNGGLLAVIGLSPESTIFDTLLLSSGIAFSYDRHRFVYELRTPTGWYSAFNVGYKSFGVSGNLYWGDNHFLLNGDRLYQAESYQRFNFYYLSCKSNRVKARIEFSVHLLPGKVDYSQLLEIYVDLNGKKPFKKRE